MLKKIVISLIVMCFSIGCFITPAQASTNDYTCVDLTPMVDKYLADYPYWISFTKDVGANDSSRYSCEGKQITYYMSAYPIVVRTTTNDIQAFESYDNDGNRVDLYYIYNKWSLSDFEPAWSRVSVYSDYTSVISKFDIKANHDIKAKDSDDIVFPKPLEPVDPEIPIVVPGEEMWTVVLDLIVRSALTIVVVGLLLMGLWISLRLLSKVLKIFSSRF